MIRLIKDPPFPHNYASEFLGLERGRGSHLWDVDGNRYIDLGAGIAVNALGYGRRDLARIASRQMRRLIHVSNLYATKPGITLAETLLSLANRELGPFSAVQFGNSGSEANEAAIKYARLFARKTRGEGHHKVLSLSNAFHGRTLGALSATPTEKYKAPFEPLVPGMVTSGYNDVAALEKTLDNTFAAVIVEVVQGEGGLRVMTGEFAEALNRLCGKHDVILIADEVQTGLGRTGKLFASEMAGLKPHILTLSKPLGGGLPLSATLIPSRINELLSPGDHGTTFGGGPVTCAVSQRVVELISEPGFLATVSERARQLTALLDDIVREKEEVIERRGRGLLQGLAIEADDTSARLAEIMNACREEGVLLLRSSSNVVRLAPPLVIGEKDLAGGVAVLRRALH